MRTLLDPAKKLKSSSNRRILNKILYPLILGLVLPIPGRTIADEVPSGLGVFQIDVIPLNTQYGLSTATTENSKQIIAKLSSTYGNATGGKISFVLRSVLPATFAEETNNNTYNQPYDSEAAETAAGATNVADAGYAGVITVEVARLNPNLSYTGTGIRYGHQVPYVGHVFMYGVWDTSDIRVFPHEIGHALGLFHSGTANCTMVIGSSTCSTQEYEDLTDIMGVGDTTDSEVSSSGLTEYELDQLGVINPSEKEYAYNSGVFNLSSVCSNETSSAKILYLPIYNFNAYEIEFQPGVGNTERPNCRASPTTHLQSYYGIQIRLITHHPTVDNPSDPLNSLLPKLDQNNFIGDTYLLANKIDSSYALHVGQSVILSDGTSIQVNSANAVSGASLNVIRPMITTSPSIGFHYFRWIQKATNSVDPTSTIVERSASGDFLWPTIQTHFAQLWDDRFISSVKLEVNGAVVDSNPIVPLVGSSTLEFTPHTVGTFKVRMLVTNSSGNTTSSEYTTLKSSFQLIQKPRQIQIITNQNSSGSFNIVVQGLNASTSYTISELSSGTLSATKQDGELTTFTISGILAGQSFSARVTGKDLQGDVDGGTLVNGVVPSPSCTGLVCHVGDTWSSSEYHFEIKTQSQIYQIQNFVKGRWIVTNTYTRAVASNGISYFNVGFGAFFTSPGIYVYRAVIPANARSALRILKTIQVSVTK